MQSNEPGFDAGLSGAAADEPRSGLLDRCCLRLSVCPTAAPYSPAEQGLQPCAAANDSSAPGDAFRYAPRDLQDAVARWLPRMRKMATAWALSQEVDDLLQDIWLELHRSWQVVVSADSPLAMALEIARRRCTKQLRKKKAGLFAAPLPAELSDAEPAARAARSSDPERQAAIAQDVSSLHAILATLDERQREAFLCRRVHGMTGEETAQVLKTTTRAAYALEEEARMKIEAEWKRRKLRAGRDGL